MAWTSDNVTEVAVIGLWTNGHEVVNVLQVKREEDSPIQSARDVLNNWQDDIVGSMLMNNYTLQGARYRDHNVADGVTGFIAPDPAKPIVGIGTGEACPPNVALLVHKNIESTGAHRAGRMYLPSWFETNVDEDGRIASAVVTGLNANLASFFSGLSGAADNELVVVHGTGSDFGVKEASLVSSLTLDPFIATQRRRLR